MSCTVTRLEPQDCQPPVITPLTKEKALNWMKTTLAMAGKFPAEYHFYAHTSMKEDLGESFEDKKIVYSQLCPPDNMYYGNMFFE